MLFIPSRLLDCFLGYVTPSASKARAPKVPTESPASGFVRMGSMERRMPGLTVPVGVGREFLVTGFTFKLDCEFCVEGAC